MRRFIAQPWQLLIHHNFTGSRSEKLGSGVVVDNYIKPSVISWLGDVVQKAARSVFNRNSTGDEEGWYERRVQRVSVPLPNSDERRNRLLKSIHGDKITGEGYWHARRVKNIFEDVPPSNKEPYINVVAEVARSVVNVSVTEVYGVPVTNDNGSGVIVNLDGTILTAFDLVANQWGWFQRQWTPKGKITVGLRDGRRIDANLIVANKDLGIAVLKIKKLRQLKAAVVGDIAESHLLNLEWPPSYCTALVGTIRSESRDIIHLYHKGFVNSCDINKVNFGGPIIDPHCRVVGISQKKPQKDPGFIIGVPIKNAIKIIKCS